MNETTETIEVEVPMNPPTCGVSVDVHIVDLMGALAMSGLGGGCFDTYRALIEVAEQVRIDNNYPVYTAQGLAVPALQKAYEQYQIAQLEKANPTSIN